MLLFGFVLSRWAPLRMYFFCRTGPQQAKDHFKDCEGVANCIVLLIVLCLWEGGDVCTCFVAKMFALLRAILRGGKNQDFLHVLAKKVVRSARAAQVLSLLADNPLQFLQLPSRALA